MELQHSKTFSYVFIGLIALSILVGGITAMIQANKTTEIQASSAKNPTVESAQKVVKALGQDYIALIRLEGQITSQPTRGSLISDESEAQQVRKALDAVAEDDKVKAVVLLVNSPGGTVGMSQELNNAVKRVREKKPIVASFLDVAASGGYYTAVAADKIVTNPGALTASIGVIMQSLNMQELFNEKLGIQSTTIKSGKFKDILNPYRETQPAEVALLQRIINDSYDDFINAVLEGRLKGVDDPKQRKALEAKIRGVADGRIVTGNQAVQVGLADQLGDLMDAKALAQSLLEELSGRKLGKELPMVDYEGDASVLKLFGLPISQAPQWLSFLPFLPKREAAALAVGSSQAPLPITVQYANQPLWLYQ